MSATFQPEYFNEALAANPTLFVVLTLGAASAGDKDASPSITNHVALILICKMYFYHLGLAPFLHNNHHLRTYLRIIVCVIFHIPQTGPAAQL